MILKFIAITGLTSTIVLLTACSSLFESKESALESSFQYLRGPLADTAGTSGKEIDRILEALRFRDESRGRLILLQEYNLDNAPPDEKADIAASQKRWWADYRNICERYEKKLAVKNVRTALNAVNYSTLLLLNGVGLEALSPEIRSLIEDMNRFSFVYEGKTVTLQLGACIVTEDDGTIVETYILDPLTCRIGQRMWRTKEIDNFYTGLIHRNVHGKKGLIFVRWKNESTIHMKEAIISEEPFVLTDKKTDAEEDTEADAEEQ